MSLARKLILEADDDEAEIHRIAGDLKRDITKKPVRAVIVGDESGTRIEFDARKGLSRLPARWRAKLADEDYQHCEPAGRVADWGGKNVNALQAAESYEVYINAEEAAAYLSVVGAPDEGMWPGKSESF